MVDHIEPVFLRPEAQPVFSWNQLNPFQREALEKLVRMLIEATQASDLDRRPPTVLPWLFNETRTQLAFINGKRGTGKTTLMTTLASGIVEPDGMKLSDQSSANSSVVDPESQDQFNTVQKLLSQLRHRVLCVQPLEMEGLPENTPLLAAILARIQRAVELRTDSREPHHQDREHLRFQQYILRVSQSLDSNLHQRRGSLDSEQFGQAVLAEEQKRLQLPSDLDQILAHLSARIPPSGHRDAPSDGKQRLLFLIPIDDLDLNPRRCMELLRLLRTYSPPRDLFFLLMGQFSLVEDIVRLAMTADFGRMRRDTAELDAVSPESLTRRLSEVAVANLRKMIPPAQRIRLEDALSAKAILEFKILSAPQTARPLRELFASIPLMTPSGKECRFRTLSDLLSCTDPDWHSHISAANSTHLGWNHYPALGIYQVPPRRLADVWLEFNQLAAARETRHVRQSLKTCASEVCRELSASFVTKLQETIDRHFRRVVDADPQLSSEAQAYLRDTPPATCVPNNAPPARYSHDLLVRNDALSIAMPTSRTGGDERRLYQPRLRITDLKSIRPIPEFDWQDSTRQVHAREASTAGRPNRIHSEQTRLAIMLRHDVHELIDDDEMTLGDANALTCVEPVRLAWVGPDGEVASFPWPVPPLRTYAATALFLNEWHHQLSRYITGQPSLAAKSSSAERPRSDNATALVDQLIARRSHTGPVDATTITAVEVAGLILLWLTVGFDALSDEIPSHSLNSTLGSSASPVELSDETPCNSSRAASSHTAAEISSHGIALEALLKRVLGLRQRAMVANKLRFWGLIDKYLRRVYQLLQPEVGSPTASFLLRQSLCELGDFSGTLAELHAQTIGMLEHQRQLRLQSLWRDPTRDLWHQLNRGVISDASHNRSDPPHWPLCLLPEPVSETENDLRADVRSVKQDILKVRSEVASIKMDVAAAAQSADKQQKELADQLRAEAALQEIRALRQQVRTIQDDDSDSHVELMDSYAERIIEPLKRFPHDRGLVREIAQLLLEISEKLIAADRWSQGRIHLTRAVEITLERNSSSETGPALVELRALSFDIEKLGMAAKEREQWIAASDCYSEYLRLIREIRDVGGKTIDSDRLLNSALIKCGDIAIRREQWEDAERLFSKALSIARRNSSEPLPSSQALRDLSIALNKYGDAAINQEKIDVANQVYHESLQIRRRLLSEDMTSGSAKRMVSISLNNCGDVSVLLGDWVNAERSYQEALEIRASLLEASRTERQTRRDYAISLKHFGDVEAHFLRWETAEKAYAESERLRRELFNDDSDSDQARQELCLILCKRSLVLFFLKDFERHAVVSEEAIEHARHLAEANATISLSKLLLADALVVLGLGSERPELRHEAWDLLGTVARTQIRIRLETPVFYEILRREFAPDMPDLYDGAPSIMLRPSWLQETSLSDLFLTHRSGTRRVRNTRSKRSNPKNARRKK